MKVSQIIPEFIEGIQQLFYPPVCIGCQEIIQRNSELPLICANCLSTLRPVAEQFVRQNIRERISSPFLDKIYVAVEFNHAVQSLIHHIKYQKMNRLAMRMGKWFGETFLKTIFREKTDLITAVPLHPIREKERGYNQSYYLARGIFTGGKIPVQGDLLFRTRHTRSQTQLNRQERVENVAGAFRLNSSTVVEGKIIILVDDVITTGATLNECARVLKAHRAAKVIAVTLATPVD